VWYFVAYLKIKNKLFTKKRACETCQIHLRSLKINMAIYTEESKLPRIIKMLPPGKNISVKDYKTRAQRLEYAEKHPAKAYKEATGVDMKKDARGIVRIAFSHHGMDMDINPEPNTNDSNRVRTMEEKVVKEKSYLEIHQYYLEKGKLVRLLGDKEVLSLVFSKRAVEKLCSLEKIIGKVSYMGDFWVALGCKKNKRPYRLFSCASKTIYLDISNGNIFLFDTSFKECESLEEKFQFGSIVFKRGDAGDYTRR
jgi:hypothetical protein